jgi:hypothetical protein
MGLIDWNASFFLKSQQIKQIEVIPHKKTHPSIDRTKQLSLWHSKWHILFLMICNNRLTFIWNMNIIKCFCVTRKAKCVILNVTHSISKIEKRNPKIAVHPKIHLKSHQFQSDKWKFQFAKAQSENTENLQTNKYYR